MTFILSQYHYFHYKIILFLEKYFIGGNYNMFFLDAHCDTITKIMNTNEKLIENKYQVDLKRMSQFSTPVQFFAIWLHPKYYSNPLMEVLKGVDFFYEEINKNNSLIEYAGSYKEIKNNVKQNKISGVLTVEGGDVLEGRLEILRVLYKLGVRSLTLTWNNKNHLGYGAMEKEKNGLTDFGKAVVKEMNRLGMIVDVSHLSEEGFWDVNKNASKPFIASHSNAQTICNHPRNLSDSQIKAIAEVGGVIGINSYPFFLNSLGKANIEDFFKHIDYVIKLVGIDFIGLGCDFDGMDCVTEGLEDLSKIKNINTYLIKKYGDNGAEKILGLNFLRVIKETMDK